jgi:hypothetical protein
VPQLTAVAFIIDIIPPMSRLITSVLVNARTGEVNAVCGTP